MRKHLLAYTYAICVLSACAPMQPLGRSVLVIKPTFTSRTTQSTIFPYTQSSIQHLVVKLFKVDGAEQELGIQTDLANAQLDNPVTFANLKANTTYRIKAYAYKAAGTLAQDLISYDTASSSVDVTLISDDRPNLANLRVALIDQPFNGQATANIAVTPGGYSLEGPEGMGFSIQGIVTTIAGNGVAAFVDGVGTSASFSYPQGIAVDLQGNIFLADTNTYRIRKITSTGVVSTVAGNGGSSFANGQGTAATFNQPQGVTFDPQGNLYIGDTFNHRIRKITPDGTVTTFAGSGSAALLDGTGSLAAFSSPYIVVIDTSGNLYVADAGNNCIRKITPGAVVTTIAGNGVAGSADGQGTAATFKAPQGVAVDSLGNLYVADTGNQRIRRISPLGMVSTLAGNSNASFSDGVGTSATFNTPKGVAVDVLGNLYVADSGNQRIRKLTPDGNVTTLAGNGTAGFADGTGTSTKWSTPEGIILDRQGYLYVADTVNHRVRRIK